MLSPRLGPLLDSRLLGHRLLGGRRRVGSGVLRLIRLAVAVPEQRLVAGRVRAIRLAFLQ
jgi:hypothetical protein